MACKSQPTTPYCGQLPRLLTPLHQPKYESMAEGELLQHCYKVFSEEIVVTDAEARCLEEVTKEQQESPEWFKHRYGRITASKFKKVLVSKIDKPPPFLMKNLMYEKPESPEEPEPLPWGIEKEPVAKAAYLSYMTRRRHYGFKCKQSGFHINPKWPHLGATPDGLISCSCCGDGLLEIKCPEKYKHVDPRTVQHKNFCLQPSRYGGIHLSKCHNSYYQIQGQLAICERRYCDFVCWTEGGMYIERINYDEAFFEKMKPGLDRFFVEVILPRILTGKKEL